MRRPRRSTWVLAAVFVTALTAYLLVRPAPSPALLVVPVATTTPHPTVPRAPASTSTRSPTPVSSAPTSPVPRTGLTAGTTAGTTRGAPTPAEVTAPPSSGVGPGG